MGAAREHGIIDAINAAGVRAVADTAYQGATRSKGGQHPPTLANADPANERTPS
jgi:hypothetical protein